MIINAENIALHKYIVEMAEAFQKALEIVFQAKAKSYLMISFLWNSSQELNSYVLKPVFTLYVGMYVCVCMGT